MKRLTFIEQPDRLMKNHFYVLLFSFFGFIACKKDPPCGDPCFPVCDVAGLPCLTNTGAGTAGFLMNGEPWVAQGEIVGSGFGTVHAQYDEITGNLELVFANVTGTDSSDVRQNLYLRIVGVQMTHNSYPIIGDDEAILLDFRDYDCNEVHSILNDTTFNYLTVKYLNTEQNIISCNYQLKLHRSEECQDTTIITNGRVDTYYIPF